MDGHVFHPADEVERVPAMLALAEAVPDVLARVYPELRRVRALVDGARAAEAVPAPLESVEDAVVLKHLLLWLLICDELSRFRR